MREPRSFARWGLAAVTTLLVGLVAAITASYVLYYSPPPANLPCRGCSGEAQAVHVGGFDLYYRSVGQRGGNPPVVLLHGGPGMSSQTFKNGFDFLADGNQVVYYDQRGSGNSQIKPDNSAYTMDKLVDELEALRRDVLASDQMILVGHSAGGALAQRYALKYPDRVSKLILVGALPANGGMRFSGLPLDAVLALMNVAAGNIPPSDPREADARMAEMGYRTSIPRLYNPDRPDLIQDFGYYSFAVNREVTRSTFGGSYDEQLSRLSIPTLIVYGEGDRSDFTGKPTAQQMHDSIPNSTIVGFEHSGHWPYLEEPERFQEVIRAFLAT